MKPKRKTEIHLDRTPAVNNFSPFEFLELIQSNGPGLILVPYADTGHAGAAEQDKMRARGGLIGGASLRHHLASLSLLQFSHQPILLVMRFAVQVGDC
jgi:hypothetical protein